MYCSETVYFSTESKFIPPFHKSEHLLQKTNKYRGSYFSALTSQVGVGSGLSPLARRPPSRSVVSAGREERSLGLLGVAGPCRAAPVRAGRVGGVFPWPGRVSPAVSLLRQWPRDPSSGH